MAGWDWKFVYVAFLGAAAVGCGSDEGDAPVASLNEFNTVCGEDPGTVGNAKAFEGAAPHPVVGIFTNNPGEGRLLATQLRNGNDAAFRARLERDVPYPDALIPAPGDVQLVACVSRTVFEQIDTCQYYLTELDSPVQTPTPPVPLYRASWQATVYDARTRTEVARSEPVDGALRCPSAIESGTETLYTDLDIDQQIALLAGFVETNP